MTNRNIVETFGCRLNTFESEVIKAHLPNSPDKQRIVFNTCAVTAEAERQARQAIRKARRNNPKAEIIKGRISQCNLNLGKNSPPKIFYISWKNKLLSFFNITFSELYLFKSI